MHELVWIKLNESKCTMKQWKIRNCVLQWSKKWIFIHYLGEFNTSDCLLLLLLLLFSWRYNPLWLYFHSPVAGFSFLVFEVSRRVTFGRTPLDEWSIRRRDIYLTTHNTHHRQTSMPPVGFETTISAAQATEYLRLRPRGYWGRQYFRLLKQNKFCDVPG